MTVAFAEKINEGGAAAEFLVPNSLAAKFNTVAFASAALAKLIFYRAILSSLSEDLLSLLHVSCRTVLIKSSPTISCNDSLCALAPNQQLCHLE